MDSWQKRKKMGMGDEMRTHLLTVTIWILVLSVRRLPLLKSPSSVQRAAWRSASFLFKSDPSDLGRPRQPLDVPSQIKITCQAPSQATPPSHMVRMLQNVLKWQLRCRS